VAQVPVTQVPVTQVVAGVGLTRETVQEVVMKMEQQQ